MPYTAWPETPVEAYVKKLSLAFAEVVNTCDFTAPIFDNVCDHFVTRHEAGKQTILSRNKKDFIRDFEKVLATCPNYHAKFLDVQATVNEVRGRARVFVLWTASGFPDGLQRDGVSEYQWERRRGDWFCVQYRGLRSFCWYNGLALYGASTVDANATEHAGVESGSESESP